MTISNRAELTLPNRSRAGDVRTPQQVFDECKKKEEEFSKSYVRSRLPRLLREKLLRRPLFVDSVAGEYEPLRRKIEGRYPYDFSIIKPKHISVPEAEWRRAQVSEHLKTLPDAALRLLFIARWLNEEGICTPEDVLPKDMLDSLVEKFRKARKISPTLAYHTVLVENWLPYFEKIQGKLCELARLNRVREEVQKLGYDPRAVDLTHRKHSILEAVYKWLGERKHIDPRNLRNSFSHMKPHPLTDL
jgi:hypothetical protein